MSKLTPSLSRVLKPYHTHELQYEEAPPTLDADGFLAFSPGDVENPKTWSRARRWWVSFAAVLMVVNATFASSTPSGVLQGISEEFGVSRQVAGLTITLFLLGYCAGPLIFAPLSEFYGRRWILCWCMVLYITFNFLCAFTQSLAGLLVGRFLTGMFASSPLSNAPAIMADLWDADERGKAMAFFVIMLQIGPALAPVISGFLQLTVGWRWCFYVLLLFGGASVGFAFAIPETYGPVLLQRKAARVRAARVPGFETVRAPAEAAERSLVRVLGTALLRPWRILWDPISFFVAVYVTFIYTLIYMLFSIYPIIYQRHRHWNAGVGQLPVLATGLGGALGGLAVFAYEHVTAKRATAARPRRPEDRLPMAMVAGALFPVFLFWFAWTAHYNSVHWIVPPIAGTFISMCIVVIFVAFTNYLVDTYLWYAASAVAINTVCRSAGAASAPLWTDYMFDALGVGPGGSVLGGVAVLLAAMPFVFYRYGAAIRARSRYAPTPKPALAGDEESGRGEGAGAGGVTEPSASDWDDAATTTGEGRGDGREKQAGPGSKLGPRASGLDGI